MPKKMLIDATHTEETRVVVVDGNKVEEFDFESEARRQLAGNIYLAKVTRVEPSLQAAFVDYGGNRHGFLAFSEIHPDYYQIPVADREALLAEEAALAAEDEEEEKPRRRRRSRSRAEKTATTDAVTSAELPEDSTAEDAGADAAAPDADAEADTAAATDAGPTGETATGQADAAAPSGDDGASATGGEIPGMAVVDLDPPEHQATAVDTPENGEIPAEELAAAAEDDNYDDGDARASDASERDENIESIAEEDVHEEIRRPRKSRLRRYKIQEVVKVRQILLVQVVKEERGNKGAALTTYLSLAGRYCVLMPNTARGGGISRKITNATDRKKLKEIASTIEVPKGAGLIIRTAGAKRTKTEIKRDYEYLQRMWEQIRDLTLRSIAPAKIYEEGDLIKRSIRDLYNREIDEVHVEGADGYRVAKDFMKMIMPSHAKNVKHYQDPLPLFARFQVESYLSSMFNPVVQLRSGGYIVIGVTEALVAIDVNSGRATKEGSIEETALKTNLEASEEVARQLRLRDLAGLIVIDYIDMEERKNNAAVEKRFKDRLKTDRARIQVGRISGFGLMEMSRQRLRPGMIEATTQPCPSCHGTGLIRSDDNLSLGILRQIEEEGVRSRTGEILLTVPVGIANFLMNQKREHIAQIEARYGLAVRIEADPRLISPDYTLEKFKTATRVVEVSAPVVSVDASLMPDEPTEEEIVETPPEAADGDGTAPKKRRRRRRRRKSGGQEGGDQPSEDATAEAGDPATDEETTATAPEAAPEDAAEAEKPKRKRTRRRRKPASADDAGPEATDATSADATAEEPATDDAAETAETAAADDEPTPAADPAPDAGRAAADAPPPEPVTAEDPPAAEPAAPQVDTEPEVTAQEPEEAPVAETEPDAAPAEPALAEADTVPAKPKRRGWWSVGR